MTPDAKRRPIEGAGESETTRVTSSSLNSTSRVKTPRPEVDAVILAIDPDRRTNGQLVADCARLGYLPEPVVDPTYGLSGMWSRHRPRSLFAFDADPSRGQAVADLGNLPLADNSAGSLLLDPPYRLGGTPTTNHDGGMDDRYGIDRYRTPDDVAELYRRGITEAARVVRPGGYVLVKCQDQICGGRLRLQTAEVIAFAQSIDLEVVDVLHLVGGRPQPPGRRQVHARRNYSTMVVFEVTR
jgi:hypothetical protein